MSNDDAVNDQLVDWLAQESTEHFLTDLLEQQEQDKSNPTTSGTEQNDDASKYKQLFIMTDTTNGTPAAPSAETNDLLDHSPQPLSPFSPTDISFPKHCPSPKNDSPGDHHQQQTLKHHQQIRISLSSPSNSSDMTVHSVSELDSTPPKSPKSSSSAARGSANDLSPRLRSDSFAENDYRSNRSPSFGQMGGFGGSPAMFGDMSGIKKFYFPFGLPGTPRYQQQQISLIEKIFASHNNQCDMDGFKEICVDVIGLSSYCTGLIADTLENMKLITTTTQQNGCDEMLSVVNLNDFLQFWKVFEKYNDAESQLFFLLASASPESSSFINNKWKTPPKFLKRSHFKRLVTFVLQNHPGLSFLESASNFHGKYVRTVIERIFYEISGSGHICDGITLRDLKKSNFIGVLGLLDVEEDINDVFDYFSYEHFYVIYCKFWELDTDHDGMIEQIQLEQYAEFSLTKRVVDRIMAGIPRKFKSNVPRTMTYEDFIPFILAEEDKKNPVSLEYWFRVLDLDGDGYLSRYEIEYFYEEQAQRIRRISRDVIDFPDYLCQLNDMIHPQKEALFTLRDLKRSKLSHLFLNMLFNLNKFALHEQRDPYLIEEIRNTPQMTDWDRFASSEYARYVDEDGGR